MKRLNFTLDDNSVSLLEELADKFYHGNKSHTVRAALESLAAHTGYGGWIITGYTPKVLDSNIHCHTCGQLHKKGDVVYQPVLEKRNSPDALSNIPSESWFDCMKCAEEHCR